MSENIQEYQLRSVCTYAINRYNPIRISLLDDTVLRYPVWPLALYDIVSPSGTMIVGGREIRLFPLLFTEFEPLLLPLVTDHNIILPKGTTMRAFLCDRVPDRIKNSIVVAEYFCMQGGLLGFKTKEVDSMDCDL